jgi:hypothetical protein
MADDIQSLEAQASYADQVTDGEANRLSEAK